MKINKSIWIIALIFILSSLSVFAFQLSDIYRNFYFILIVNGLIIWSILFLAQMFLIPNQDAKVKLVVWIATFAIAALILWNFTQRGAAYLWEAGWIAQYLKLWIIVNTILFSIGLHILAGFFELKTETNSGKIGLIILAILLGALMANNLGNKPLWDTQNFQKLKDYLLGGTHEETRPDGTKVTVGGILTLDNKDVFESRLFIFLISSILFAWFFNSYLGLGQQNNKLTYLMAFIIGANLARQGTTSGTIIGLAEAFAILIVGQQVMHTWGGQRLIAYLISIVLVEWIFCAVFNQSRLFLFIGGILKALLQNNAILAIVVLWITFQSLRSPNPMVWLGTLIGGALLAITNKITGLIGDFVAGIINLDICGILSQSKIIATASAGTGTIVSSIGGGATQFAGFIPPSASLGIGAIITILMIIVSVVAWRHIR